MLSLISGQEITDVLFRLVRAGVITGKVVDDTGEPMIGVNVTVLHKPSEEEREDAGPRAKKVEMTIASVGHDRRSRRVSHPRTQARGILLKAIEDDLDPFMGQQAAPWRRNVWCCKRSAVSLRRCIIPACCNSTRRNP